MTVYCVTWELNVEAATPKEAAEKARRMACNEDSTATVFRVAEWMGEGGIDGGPIFEHVAIFDVIAQASHPHYRAVPWDGDGYNEQV